jgi:hypothetical protein
MYESIFEKRLLNPLSSALISSLAYFSIFKHPLKRNELRQYCHYLKRSDEEMDQEIKKLVAEGIIGQKDDFIFLSGEEINIGRRLEGEKSSKGFMKSAGIFSKIISYFPFVRAVLISGSLSKGYMDQDSDIDYFIITQPKRLWVCRTLLVLFKKIFLLNSRKHFCVNYFIDSDNLQIPDQNIFTATELVFILPMYNTALYKLLMQSNSWTQEYYPNMINIKSTSDNAFIKHSLTHLFEKMLSGNFGEWLDSWCFNKTISHWKNKFRDFNEEAFDMELRSRKNVSKHHPRGFQKKILDSYHQKISELETLFGFQFYFDISDAKAKEASIEISKAPLLIKV